MKGFTLHYREKVYYWKEGMKFPQVGLDVTALAGVVYFVVRRADANAPQCNVAIPEKDIPVLIDALRTASAHK